MTNVDVTGGGQYAYDFLFELREQARERAIGFTLPAASRDTEPTRQFVRTVEALGATVKFKTEKPHRLAAEARRWLTGHTGPQTRATLAVRQALARYYDDLVVLDAISNYREKTS